MTKWKVVLRIKTKNGEQNHQTVVEAKIKEGAILAARQEIEKEYTILRVVSVERK